MVWLPYRGWEKNMINVTYFGNEQPLKMPDAWRKTAPITSQRPWCVIGRFGKILGCSGFFKHIQIFLFSS